MRFRPVGLIPSRRFAARIPGVTAMTHGENTKASDGAVLSADIPLLSIDRLTVKSGGIPLIDELELRAGR